MGRASPSFVRWTDHAAAKADALGVPRMQVEDAVLGRDPHRSRNPGAARWRVAVGRLVVAYDYPDGNDQMAARVITLWRT